MHTKRLCIRCYSLIAILLALTALSCADYPEGATRNRGVIVPDITFDAAEDTVLTLAADAGVFTQIEEADPTTWSVATTGSLTTTGPSDCEACEKGSVDMSSDGSFSYTPATDFEGKDYLTISVATDTGSEGEYIILFEVAGSNDPPSAADDSAATDEDAALTLSPLENDTDIDLGDSFALVSVDAPENGTATADVDTGEVAYTPAANYFGEDSFAYTIADAAGVEATATITVTVNAVNDPPAAEADAYASDEDTPLTVAAADGVLLNDSDIEDDAFEVTAGSLTSAQGGTVEIQADGSFTYTPASNYNGDDSFTYTVIDVNDGSAQATVTLAVAPVNDPPSASNDTYTAEEDAPLTVAAGQGVLGNDTDIDGDELEAVTGTLATNQGGSVNLAADGGFSYSPAANFNGADSFTYNVSDRRGGLSPATVTLNVTPMADPPVAVNDRDIAVLEETATPIDVLANDRDPDGDTLTIVAVTNGSNGSVANTNGRSVTYTPVNNFEGTDSFTYTISDGDREDTATVTVIVGNVNDAPTAVDDTRETTEDSAVLIPVIANDTDPDQGDNLTVQSLSTLPTNGTAAISANLRNVTYTPDLDFVGIDTFTYVVQDRDGLTDEATVTVTVTNADPVANGDGFGNITSRNPVSINVLNNDVNGGSIANPGEGVSVASVTYAGTTYTPTASNVVTFRVAFGVLSLNSVTGTMSIDSDDNGGSFVSEQLTYSVVDDYGAVSPEATVTWRFIFFDDFFSLSAPPFHQTEEDNDLSINRNAGVLAEAGSAWSVSTTAAAETLFGGSATVNGNGSFSYTPPPNFSGTDSFGFTATDNGSPAATADGQIAVSVDPVDDAPLPQNDRYAVAVGGSIVVSAAQGLLHNDIDLEGSSLTVSAVNTGTLAGTLSGLQANGAFSYTAPGDVDEGSTTAFSYTVSAGGRQETATVTVVFSTGDAPLANTDTYTATEDTTRTVGGSGVRANDIGGTAASAVVSSHFGGSVSMNAGGSFTYTPPANFSGTDSFAYQLSDASQSVNGLVRINVSAAADAPLAGDDFFQTGTNTPIAIAAATGLLANDNDADGDSLTVTTTGLISTDEGGSADIDADGSFTYVPPADFTGTDRFDYTMGDGTGRFAAATVIVTVSP